jgi:sucrose-6-phosphate hydrolase SacC (GH32 family)
VRLRSEKGEPFAEIAYDPGLPDGELRVNKTRGTLHTNEPISLRLLLDGSALEVFANHKTVITARVYSAPSAPLVVEVSDPDALRSLSVWQMKAISKDRLTT